nr:MAG TPA: hypothetical protein [Caudoviricetes sp.]
MFLEVCDAVFGFDWAIGLGFVAWRLRRAA